MECVAVFLLVVIGLIVVTASLGERMFAGRRRRRLFTELTKRFSGFYDSGGIFSQPSVRLRYGDTWAIFNECRAAGPFPGPSLQMRIAWPHSQIKCEIIANFGQPVAGRGHAWPIVSVDDQDFAKRYVVLGPKDIDVRQLLTAGVQWQIERLRMAGDDERLYVWIADSQIVVQKRFGRSRDLPVPFVQGVFDLYDQCMLAKASGIEFLHSGDAQTLEQVVCKVCGESILDDLVYCRRCKTPHHQECWQYTGACSIYGCRETVYLLPQQSKASVPSPPPNAE